MQDTFEIVDIPSRGKGPAPNPFRESIIQSLFNLEGGKALLVSTDNTKRLYSTLVQSINRSTPECKLHRRMVPGAIYLWISKRSAI